MPGKRHRRDAGGKAVIAVGLRFLGRHQRMVFLVKTVDKAKGVRYRGAMLLAYSLRKDVLPQLRAALETLADGPGAGDLAAAIDAIENENHNYFVDRTHSGKIMLTIE